MLHTSSFEVQQQVLDAAVWEIRDWAGNLESKKATPCKFASRVALVFSSTIPTFDVRISKIPDVERGGFCFTDGAGQISPACAQKLASHLHLKTVPSAFQVRIAGAKGVIVVGPSSEESWEVRLRPSQIKFEAAGFCQLEILSHSRMNPCFLNQQIILLLVARGTPKQVIVTTMSDALKGAASLVTDKKAAAASYCVSICCDQVIDSSLCLVCPSLAYFFNICTSWR